MKSEAPRPWGFSEHFFVGEYERADRVVSAIHQAGFTSLRVDVSARDYYARGGTEWHEWLFRRIASELELLPCLAFSSTAADSPSRGVRVYADFVDTILTHHGKHFDYLELSSPPPPMSGDGVRDLWLRSTESLTAILQATRGGWNVVLGTGAPGLPSSGGPSTHPEFYWIRALCERGLLDQVSAVSLQGLHQPKTWNRFQQLARRLQGVLDAHGARATLWLTEGGYPSSARNETLQARHLAAFLSVPAERHYWRSWQDRPAVEAPLQDQRLGVVRADGRPKLVARLLQQDTATRNACLMVEPISVRSAAHPPVVILGGAGFIGSNLAKSFLEDGEQVIVIDNLSRPGVEHNLRWLKSRYGDRLQAKLTDIREEPNLGEILRGVRAVVHLAAQVAVTTSLLDPLEDFDVNAYGTLRVLEALRNNGANVPLLFASTNKVYGDLADIQLEETPEGYLPIDPALRERGIDERQPLDFRTPYGCSKGVADQYVLDYARSFGLPLAVLRMSCIYGPRQFGTEDQGWVAHFLLRAIRRQPIVLYGDGRQVRDVLHVDDAVRAYRLLLDCIQETRGRAFNLGGGPKNAICLNRLLMEIESVTGEKVHVSRAQPRRGDQLYFVADAGRIERAVGWQPEIDWRAGLRDLLGWLESLDPQAGGAGAASVRGTVTA